MTTQPRQPAGIPTGGEFATITHTEADIALEQGEEWPEPEQNHTFHMRSSRLGEAMERIEKANARLARAGIEARFTYTVQTYVKTSQTGVHTEMAAVELNQPVLSFDGWSFTGAFDFTPDGSVIAAYRGENAPDVTEPSCEHCGSNRRRDRVYTLHSDTEGDKQVGKTCLGAFLGIRPAGLWALGDDLNLSEFDADSDLDDDSHRRGGSSQVFPAEDLIAAALAISDDGKNFLSRAKATFNEPSTGQLLLDGWDTAFQQVTDKQQVAARELIAWVKDQDSTGNDYLQNLQAALVGGEGKWVKRKHVALAVSVIAAHNAALDREREKQIRKEQKAARKKEFLAPKGEKIGDLTATVQLIRQFESGFGYGSSRKMNTMVVMITDTGHTVKWTTASSIPYGQGDRVKIGKATVKGNDMYGTGDDAQWQTVVIRAQLEPLGGDEDDDTVADS